jgi:hypothetical protein
MKSPKRRLFKEVTWQEDGETYVKESRWQLAMWKAWLLKMKIKRLFSNSAYKSANEDFSKDIPF